MDYVDSPLELIGHTPLLRLSPALEAPGHEGLGGAPGPMVLAKLEFLNPGGSVKDRIALRMVEAAEASGELGPGGVIVEPTSGNTGIGLAMVAQERGYHCIFVCPDKVSEDKQNVLKAYGAEVVVCPTAVAPEHPDSYYSVSDRLVRETPGAWKPDQYSNQANPRSHYETTGPEIWQQTEGRVTHFVAGVGTGGTITGVGRYLKEQNPAVQVVGADPAGSVYSGGTGRPYLVEGVGEDFWPTTYDPDLADRVIEVSDADSFRMARRLARQEGILVGGSSGMAVHAAVQLAHELAGTPDGERAVIVVLIPDGGRGYLSKVFNDDWLAQYGFAVEGSARALQTVGEVLRGKSRHLPDLVHTHPNETVAQAIAILEEYGVSQMPVVRAEPPIVAAEVAGSVSERTLLDALYAGTAALSDAVDKHLSPALPSIGSTEPASAAVAMLEGADAVLVHEDGKPVGVVTRHDLLTYLARGVTPVSVEEGTALQQQLEACLEAEREAARLDVLLTTAHAAAEEERAGLASARARLTDEDADVADLETFSLARIRAWLRGSRLEDLDRERGEAQAAAYAVAVAERRLQVAEERIATLDVERDLARRLARAKPDVMERREAWLREHRPGEAAALDDLAARSGAARDEAREIDEALVAAHGALSALAYAASLLDSARSWSTYDTFFGGGAISSMVKHERIDAATGALRLADERLRVLGVELRDVGMTDTWRLDIPDGRRIFDIWFDNIVSDLRVRDSVLRAVEQVTAMRGRVEQVAGELQPRRREVAATLARLDDDRAARLSG